MVISLIAVSCTAASNTAKTASTVASEVPVDTQRISPTATRTLQPTSMPTALPSSTPDVPLSESGSWLFYKGAFEDVEERNSHLWVINWDGTGLTNLLPEFWVWQYEVQPSINGIPGHYLAAITSYGWSDQFMLTIARLPDGEIETIIPLTNSQTILIDKTPENEVEALQRASASYAISDLRSLVWSPDGRQLAFAGAQDGTQADVYVYSLDDKRVSRLTWQQHLNHASGLMWSPSGEYIAFEGITEKV